MSSAPRGVALGSLVLALAACSMLSPRTASTAPSADVSASARVPRVPMVWVPQWGVHVIEGYDIVYYEESYYFYVESHWYIARSPAGPWALVPAPPPALAALPPGAFRLYLSGEGSPAPPAR